MKIPFLTSVTIAFLIPLSVIGQVEKKPLSKAMEIKIPFDKDTFPMPYVLVYGPEGLVKLATKITDTSKYPLIVVQSSHAEPFLGVLQIHLKKTDNLMTLNQQQTDRIAVLEEKERIRKDVDSMQDNRIAYLKKYNTDLKSINDTLCIQYKAAISTAKEANKGWSWQGLKDLILGTAAGLAIGLLIGLTR